MVWPSPEKSSPRSAVPVTRTRKSRDTLSLRRRFLSKGEAGQGSALKTCSLDSLPKLFTKRRHPEKRIDGIAPPSIQKRRSRLQARMEPTGLNRAVTE